MKWSVQSSKILKKLEFPMSKNENIIYFSIIEPPYYKTTMQVVVTNKKAYIYEDVGNKIFSIENFSLEEDYIVCSKMLDVEKGRFYLVFGINKRIELWDPCVTGKGLDDPINVLVSEVYGKSNIAN